MIVRFCCKLLSESKYFCIFFLSLFGGVRKKLYLCNVKEKNEDEI